MEGGKIKMQMKARKMGNSEVGKRVTVPYWLLASGYFPHRTESFIYPLFLL